MTLYPTDDQTVPNCVQAEINKEKLVNYCLDPLHEIGKNKARVFERALGYNQSNWRVLEQDILRGLAHNNFTEKTEGPFGVKYTVEMPLTGPNGSTATVVTVWIIRSNTDRPSLVTAYVGKK